MKPRKKMRGHKNSCDGKKGFNTIADADKASRRGRYDFMEAYKCRKCKRFHFGHPKKSTFSMGI